jgi:carboxyl-terminal processing protease
MFPQKKMVRLLIVAVLLAAIAVIAMAAGGKGDSHADNDYQSIELFTDVLAIVKRNYVEEVDTKKLIQGAINGMLASLDPHSSYMPPEAYKEMKIDTKGSFGGLGIEISIKDGMLTIISPIEDTPAFKAGLKSGDQILKIDDHFTKDLSIMEAVKRMRGAKGSKVTLTIMREGFDKPKDFVLVRDVIQVKSVKYKTLDSGYGYVRIVQFQERTADDLTKALALLREENGGNLRGLVLDLRNNPGGLLDQAVKVSDLFLDSGLIVYTDGRDRESKMQFMATKGGEPNYPMVVVINSGSASASEIVAGALQDQNRAVIMGTQSFGKGSVQTVIPLEDQSALKLTTARYYTPKGRSIQAKGIVPDIVVDEMALPQIEKKEGMHIREKDLENHFETEGGGNEKKDDKKTPAAKDDDPLRNDYQILRALDLLKGWDILKAIEKKG